MRGKVAKRLRRLARLAAQGDVEAFDDLYQLAKHTWITAARQGKIKQVGQQTEHHEADH